MPEGSGTVTISPAMPPGGYTEPTEVTLTAQGNRGYVFDHWSGDIRVNNVDKNPTTVTVGAIHTSPDLTINAHFVTSDARFALAFAVSPTGSGRIVLTPSQPAEGYLVNEKITVTATANPGYQFSQWGGDLTGSTKTASLVMDRKKTITATFSPLYRLTVNANPIGGGTVTLAPAQSAEGYIAGTKVTLTATAGEGYKFDGWSGDLSSLANPTTIAVSSDKVITANFAKAGGFSSWLLIAIIVVVVIVGLPLGFLVITRLLRAA